MPIYDIYSKRKKRAETPESDVYIYDAFSSEVRTQILFILESALGTYERYGGTGSQNNEAWEFIRNALCREWGVRSLGNDEGKRDVESLIYNEQNIERILDLLEIAFRVIEVQSTEIQGQRRRERGITEQADDAVKELNHRLREAGIGYRYEERQIIRIDNELIHTEIVKPALFLLTDPRFEGPRDEYLQAHAHYRAGENRDAITDANNAYESTMKTICDIKGWEYPSGAAASHLIKVLRDNDLFPNYLENSFEQLASTLKSGLPQVRNNEGGHGGGAEVQQTPEYVASYALHLAAAKIVFLVEALKATE